MRIQAPEPSLEKLGDAVVFQIQSAENPAVHHYVLYFENGQGIRCSCKGWQFRGVCKHTMMIPLCMAQRAFDRESPTCGLIQGHSGLHTFEKFATETTQGSTPIGGPYGRTE